jgi:gamma-glutamylcyclotransferase (GGCT)/AIG2-like uncharacterized protein YtfP
MNKQGLYAFYGTLRKGMDNYSIYRHGMTYRQTVILEGFRMYSLGDYPYAIPTSTGSIVADLFFVDKAMSRAIDAMEVDAGYFYGEVVVDRDPYGIYLFHRAFEGDKEIVSGDWLKFLSENDF